MDEFRTGNIDGMEDVDLDMIGLYLRTIATPGYSGRKVARR